MLTAFGAIPEDGRVVRDGNIITGGGVTAGVDFALILIAELWGEQAAQSVQLLLEYAPAPPFDAGLPETAPAQVRQIVLARMADAMADGRRRIDSVAHQIRSRALGAVTQSHQTTPTMRAAPDGVRT
ncbi:MAG: hypothetical protein V4793_00360 [Paraburkholderia tropica]|nr:hypothetical protein [Paraburkholderia tropica]